VALGAGVSSVFARKDRGARTREFVRDHVTLHAADDRAAVVDRVVGATVRHACGWSRSGKKFETRGRTGFVRGYAGFTTTGMQALLLQPRDDALWKFYKDHCGVVWFPEDIKELTVDQDSFAGMQAGEQYHIKLILTFFRFADALVNANLDCNFTKDFEGHQEVLAFYAVQSLMETVHWETYEILFQAYVPEAEHEIWVRAISDMPCLRNKKDFMEKYMNRDMPLCKRLWAFALAEGILFSSSFASIRHYGTRGLPALVQANEYIARDEGLHQKFACALYCKQTEQLSEQEAYEILDAAFDLECAFAFEALVDLNTGGNRVVNLTFDDMQAHVKACANNLCKDIGLPPRFHGAVPLDAQAMVHARTKNNFFEREGAEYAPGPAGGFALQF
jgi:ribonucleoside-diphosphate reductase subunit M2